MEFAEWARKDLLGIARYIARDNPQRARSFVSELRQQCALLAEQPGLGVARPDLAADLRQLPYERYVIFFSEIDSGVLIERVLHSARNLTQQFDAPFEPSSDEH
ncbi:MAG TPA: type II toxin-antitoxin system RelE/ParE family toxin [Gallionella sp.]|nr:type II toxin-antitoxin system RelE/ParE family toxin [Gallionella sp.]